MTIVMAVLCFVCAAETGEAGKIGYCIWFSVWGTLLSALACYKAYLFVLDLKQENK